jgi:hypothetical protein
MRVFQAHKPTARVTGYSLFMADPVLFHMQLKHGAKSSHFWSSPVFHLTIFKKDK